MKDIFRCRKSKQKKLRPSRPTVNLRKRVQIVTTVDTTFTFLKKTSWAVVWWDPSHSDPPWTVPLITLKFPGKNPVVFVVFWFQRQVTGKLVKNEGWNLVETISRCSLMCLLWVPSVAIVWQSKPVWITYFSRLKIVLSTFGRTRKQFKGSSPEIV